MKALNFLVYSNIWISLGAGLLSLLTFQFFPENGSTSQEISYGLFVFFCTLFSYNFQRVARLKAISNSTPTAWVVKNEKVAKAFLIISIIGAFIFAPIFDYPFTLGWLVLLGFISFGYSYRKLRDLPHIKIILIALSWGITCGVIPLMLLNNISVTTTILSFGWIFFYIIAITIPFDIRDMTVDELTTKTLPQWLGVKRSKNIGYVSLGISLLFLFPLISVFGFLIMIVCFLLAAFLIKNSHSSQSDFYYSFYVDGHIILQFFAVYFFA